MDELKLTTCLQKYQATQAHQSVARLYDEMGNSQGEFYKSYMAALSETPS